MTKPGIIYGNAITTIAGFLYASTATINFTLLIYTILGISLIIASACVFNNYIDRDIDKLMSRTKNRALVKNLVPKNKALSFATTIGLVGFAIILVHVNILVFLIGLVAFVDYVGLYGFAKRKTHHGTLVGSISGAAPILAGYCAVTNHIGVTGTILFLILVFWQMPHFYAISIYRLKDYKSAKIPVLPVVKGIRTTKKYIICYVVLFAIMVILLKIYSHAGYVYLAGISLLSIAWLYLGLSGFKKLSDTVWARKMFFFSLIVLLGFSFLISINKWLA